MPRASKTITLVLMGSAALLLSGASCDQKQQATTQPAGGTGGHYVPVHHFAPGGGRSPSTPHASPRSGFGSTGHAVGA